MIIENKEYIQSFTPHANGCKFVFIVKNNGDIYYKPGCNLRPNLLFGADRYLWEMFSDNKEQSVKLNISPILKTELMKINSCDECGGTLFEHE